MLRKVARQVRDEGSRLQARPSTAPKVRELLGKAKFRSQQIHDKSEIGLATGLAWTEVGGEILSTEVALSRGKGNLTLTGKLGDVMQESARAALSYVRSRAELFGLDADFHANLGHPHPRPRGRDPEGRPVGRHHHGHGAALRRHAHPGASRHRHDRRDHAARQGAPGRRREGQDPRRRPRRHHAHHPPAENERDLEDIPADVREKMEFHLVESMDEVVLLALDGTIVPLAAKENCPSRSEPNSTH